MSATTISPISKENVSLVENLLGCTLQEAQIFECHSDSQLFHLLVTHFTNNSALNSFQIKEINESSDTETCTGKYSNNQISAGPCAFKYELESGEEMVVIIQLKGKPVATQCGITIYKSLCMLVKGVQKHHLVRQLATEVIKKARVKTPDTFKIFRWNARHEYWSREQISQARPFDSIILPRKQKKMLIEDLEEFLLPETQEFYKKHGIPYKRSYLFHGVPGAGKSSLIQAIAGKYKRDVYILNPSDSNMSDSSLKAAMIRASNSAVIILEDVDALFDKSRKKKDLGNSSVTFSGLLNAVDGVGGANGQFFVMTTNHKERLDPALIRVGRVDAQFEFKHATYQQAVDIFHSFYQNPKDKQFAKMFADKLFLLLQKQKLEVSMASLQGFFVNMRKKSAFDAANGVENIIEHLKEISKIEEVKEVKKEATEKVESDSKKKKNIEESSRIEKILKRVLLELETEEKGTHDKSASL